MRTDCTICTYTEIRLPQIPLFSPGRRHTAKRGDVIVWQLPGSTGSDIGRVIGSVTAADLEGHHLCVVGMFGGSLFERWVDPADVIDCFSIDMWHAKLQWLFGPGFIATSVDDARQIGDKLMKDIRIDNPPVSYAMKNKQER